MFTLLFTELESMTVTVGYVLFLSITILFTLLCVEAEEATKKIVFGGFSMVLWWVCSAMNMGVAPADSVTQAPVSIMFLGFGLFMLVLTAKAGFDGWRLAYDKKYDVSTL
jgi:succinate-acetate transporter protein